jgi:excisionase family DNA binding protein
MTTMAEVDPDLPANLLRPKDAAILANVTPFTIKRWTREGRLTAYRLGPRDLRVDRRDVVRLLARSATS